MIGVIPYRPGRKQRLECFVEQFRDYVVNKPFEGSKNIVIQPNLLKYRAGVRSHSGERLDSAARFSNVLNHLYVQMPKSVSVHKRVLIIDDVCTTGSSLINSCLKLHAVGAERVDLLAISMNIGNVLYD